jgi:hypothetical protein
MGSARDPAYIRRNRGNHALGIVYVLSTSPAEMTSGDPRNVPEQDDDWQDEPVYEDEFADWFGSFD